MNLGLIRHFLAILNGSVPSGSFLPGDAASRFGLLAGVVCGVTFSPFVLRGSNFQESHVTLSQEEAISRELLNTFMQDSRQSSAQGFHGFFQDSVTSPLSETNEQLPNAALKPSETSDVSSFAVNSIVPQIENSTSANSNSSSGSSTQEVIDRQNSAANPTSTQVATHSSARAMQVATHALKRESALKSQVSFIAGLIAVHRPELHDVPDLARDIVEISLRSGIDPFYTAAIISVESRFGTEAKSHKGATGLMQLMPGTAREVFESKTGRNTNPRLTDERINIALGIEYIKQLEKQFSGDHFNVLAAYNWGPGNVSSALDRDKKFPKSVEKYAQTILTRAASWRKHFLGAAKQGAALSEDLAAVSLPLSHHNLA
ncbi:lytic transglycosylase domain-containing protein [bacterium]|nr:lytic transglycosylase domain-containing protein [bacterium]